MRFAHDSERPDDHAEDSLDRDFPLGDGSADVDAIVICPYCAEEVSVTLDPGSGPSQDYVEDCPVCCQPWQVNVRYSDDGSARVSIAAM
jgi:hypothetical protein